MLFLRSVLFFLGQFITAPIFTFIAFLALPLNPVTRNVLISGWARSMIWWLRISCNIRHEVTGLENLPDTPSIILSKHQSAWETLAFQAIFPTQVYVLKRELLWIPIFGWGLAMSSPIAIDRSAGREALKKLVSNGSARLKKGLWVVIFPEGTRVAPGSQPPLQSGFAGLYKLINLPVVPIAVNSGTLSPRKTGIWKSGTITYKVGEELPTGLPREDIEARVHAAINALN